MPSLTVGLTYVKPESDTDARIAAGILPMALLLTGRPGVGKTTVLRAAATKLAPFHLLGFYPRARPKLGDDFTRI